MARKKYENFVQNNSGDVVAGASATFYPAGNHSVPSTIYSVSAAGSPASNPQVTNSNGMFGAYLEDGRYDIQIAAAGLTTFWLSDIISIAYEETERTDNKGVSGGYCPLDSSIKVPEANLTTRNVIPAGSIWMFGGSAAPSGWVLCDGSYLDGTTAANSALYAVIGTVYGGSGAANFRVPYFNGRSPVGVGAGTTKITSYSLGSMSSQTIASTGMTIVGTYSGSEPTGIPTSGKIWYYVYGGGGWTGVQNMVAAQYSSRVITGSGVTWQITFNLTASTGVGSAAGTSVGFVLTSVMGTGTTRARGDVPGSENHILNNAEIPSHYHGIPVFGDAGATGPDWAGVTHYNYRATYNTGGGLEHPILSPMLAVNFIIKL